MSTSKQKRKPNSATSNDLQQNVLNLLDNLLPLLPKEEHASLITELEKPLRSAFRINPLKNRPSENFSEKLTNRFGWKLSPISYCDGGYWLESETEISLGQTWEHRLGRYYVQDASSMLPVELFDFSKIEDPLVLDLAASPGGKTTHIISKTMDKGLVIANDASKDRIQALRIVLQNWGGIRQAITQFQGERFGQWLPNTFDAILLDAPCSMQNLRPTEARPMRPISEREESTLAKRQSKLLESALFSAKPGGQIVYATCTLSPEEDELVLDWLLSKYPDSVKVEDLSSQLRIDAPGIDSINANVLHPDVKNAFRLWPHRLSSSGFFCARITKTDDLHGKIKQVPTFNIEQTDFSMLDAQRMDKVVDFFKRFNINLVEKYLSHGISLWQRKSTIFLFPDRFFHQIGYLPLRSLGQPIAEITQDGFTPDHFFFARNFYEEDLPSTIIDPNTAVDWQSGSTIPIPIPMPNPIKDDFLVLQTETNEFLGIGKRNGKEIKNLLPRRMIL